MIRLFFIFFAINLLSTSVLMGQTQRRTNPSKFQTRVAYFKQNPISTGSIVYLGNSLVEYGEWETYFESVKPVNRGIVGNNTKGMLKILPEIVEAKPSKLFFIGGINDIAQNVPTHRILNNIKRIIESVKLQSPTTKIYLHSLLPINNSFARYTSLLGKESQVKELNRELEKMAQQKDVVFINLYPSFLDAEGESLDVRYTEDGLHLTPEGYRVWVELDKEYIFE